MNKNELHDAILKEQSNICQIVARKNGEEVYSDTWNNSTKQDTYHTASVTKSIISLLFGIAIDKGLINNLEQKVLDYFPDYQIKRGEKTIQQVSLKNLLTLTAPYKFKSEPWTKVCGSEDWSKSVLDLLGGRAGITGEFKYTTLGIQLLSTIISKVSKMPTIEFANKFLFEPLGIAHYTGFVAKSKEEHIKFITSKQPKEHIWFCESKEVVAVGFGLCMAAKDMAKIGQMCLDDGMFNGKQIISTNWIKKIKTKYVNCGERFNNVAYGGLWWIIDEEKSIYAAIGDSGNVIYINKKAQLVISITSTFKPAVFDRIEFIQKILEPFINNSDRIDLTIS